RFHAEADRERPRLVLVSGPAGIGKTALTEEFSRRVEELEAPVFSGRFDPDPSGPYRPILDILALSGAALAAQRVSASSNDIELLLSYAEFDGRAEAAPLREDNEVARYRLYEAVTAAINEIPGRPLVLVIENLQWADRPSLLLLRHIL